MKTTERRQGNLRGEEQRRRRHEGKERRRARPPEGANSRGGHTFRDADAKE